MKAQNRMSALVIEMIGSVAICGMVAATDLLLGARRRRTPGS